MELVSVVIANCNKKDYLYNCLGSLRKQTHPNIEIIVVDNGSTDGSLEMVRNNFPHVKLIVNQQNELYCHAQNQGINQAKGKFILSLNNDTILERNYIEELVKVMGEDERIGLATGKILSMDKMTIDTTGQFLGRSRKPIERGYKQRDKGQFESSGYVFGGSGVAALYRRKMLEEIKIGSEYFDETYGVFYEDLDISWRANGRGWKAFYTPRALAYHIRGGTAKSQKPPAKLFKNYDFAYLPRELQAHLIKNRYITIIKNDSLGGIFLNLPFILLYELKLWTYICIFAPYLILDMLNNIKYLKSALRRRKEAFQSVFKIEEYLSTILYVIATGTVIFLSLQVEYCFPLDKKIAKLLGLFIIFTGIFLALWAIIHIKGGILGMVKPRLNMLVNEGPYKFIRHPFYLGLTIILLGVTVVLRSWIGLVGVFLLFLPSVIYRAKLEDKVLARKFGAEWKNYASRTGFILPFTKRG